MFQSEELDQHLKLSNTIETESVIFAEWNLNDTDNLEKIGNYRYRPGTTDNQFSLIPITYDPFDNGEYYTNATNAEISVQIGFDDEDLPTLFTTKVEKIKLLYSLEDCLKPHRPRSGINKLLYLGNTANQYVDMGERIPETQEILNIAKRPRYYMSSRYDQFKYWTSYRTEVVDEEQQEFGVSLNSENSPYYIYDACPFVVYKSDIPVNKIVVKMQTNVGTVDLGPFRVGEGEISDPLYGFENQTTPQRWSIQILKGDTWVNIIDFNENSVNDLDQPVIGSDGYVQISYGLILPEPYKSFFIYAGELANDSLLPESAPLGYTYLIKNSEEDIGVLKIYDDGWVTLIPEYGWALSSQTLDIRTPVVTKLNNPEYFVNSSGETQFREFEFLRGIRIVVRTMNKPECTFDLIEFSPRLFADITNKATSFSITKTMSDLGNSSIPVGNILASTGSLELFDNDSSFNSNNIFNFNDNTGSIISNYLDVRVKFDFYQIIKNVNSFDYFIPIKSMYTDSVPAVSNSTSIINVSLRDLFFLLESEPAPELLIRDVSISYAITLLLDYIGFSNYAFRRVEGIPEIVIPFFFVGPDQNVAEVLAQLAIASQTSIFFDEYNNLIVMSKEYLLPEINQRQTDSFLFGQNEENGLANIINLSSEEKKVYNQGKINYTTRYIQRAISKYSQAPYVDKYKTYGYKPALLWEISGREQLRSQNEAIVETQGFTLGAVPLSTDLSSELPTVNANQTIINNIVDVGENVDFGIASYQGYFYANGEIIKYDAIEYAVSGLSGNNIVWIKSAQEYQKYFSQLPFNGKIYPTGNIRIFAEPEYEILDNELRLKEGPVKKHGRGQFGTPITSHSAGMNVYWRDNANVQGCLQQTKNYLFNTSEIINYPDNLTENVAGKIDTTIPGISYFDSNAQSQSSSRTGVIKNFRANKFYTEKELSYFDTARSGTMQSSALVFSGPETPQQIQPSDFISYVYKKLDGPYKHFGTRMRIVGKVESTNQKSQTPFGAFPIFETQNLNIDDPSKNIQILGGAGGLAFGLNKETNVGYYFEIVSLTQDNINQYNGANKNNPVNYKILSSPAPSCVNNVVTVVSETEIKFIVGQTIQIFGLVDSLNPSDTRTPLNGEYKITAINTDKKTFQYTIPGTPIANRTSTTGGIAVITEPGQNIVSNVYFYKILADENAKAIPVKLWSGIANILVDDGKFTGQYRFVGEQNSTVYDLSAEYIDIEGGRRFYLYINGKQIATVTDTSPLTLYNNIALFVRGTSKCMFENIFAIGANISQNSKVPVATPISKIFGDDEIDANESLRKYAISGVIQKTYLSGIGSEEPPSHILYFDEFGTIMREAAYLNIKYDRSFPALYARVMKTFNRLKGYTISGFYAGSYGADFLIFNCLDTNINLDDTTGNFVRIQGITFTQNTTKSFDVDDYYKKVSNLSDPIINPDGTLVNSLIQREEYNRIVNSRTKYGTNEFTIESPYIQTDDVAEEIFGWTIDKISKPRIVLGLNTFSTFNLQLGDILQINYKNVDGIDVISDTDKRFVVYNMEYSKNSGSENTTMYLVEV